MIKTPHHCNNTCKIQHIWNKEVWLKVVTAFLKHKAWIPDLLSVAFLNDYISLHILQIAHVILSDYKATDFYIFIYLI